MHDLNWIEVWREVDEVSGGFLGEEGKAGVGFEKVLHNGEKRVESYAAPTAGVLP